MIRRAIVLTGLYLVTTALLAGIFHANSLVLMGIHDVCASQCAGAAGVGLGILYVAALAQVGLAVMATGCHERGQLIMLAAGSARRVEDIAVGDLLMGPDLTPRTVLSLARGRQEMRRIIPETGPAWVVNLDHVLTLANGGDDLGLRDPSSWIDITVREYLREQRGEWHPLSLIRVTPTGRALVPFWTEKMPEDDYFGFTLDGDHRYLLADGTVTHNCGKTPRFGLRFAWFARVCLGHLLISLVWLLWGVPFRPQPTPYLLLSAWLSIAAMEAAGAVVRRLRWR